MEKAKAVVMSDEMIDFFVNAVFVYDDRVTITFNYSGDNRTITLPEVDAAAQGVCGLGTTGHHVGASCISLAPTFSKVRVRSLRCFSLQKNLRFQPNVIKLRISRT